MRPARSRKWGLLQSSLLLSILATAPAWAQSIHDANCRLLAQSGTEPSSTGAQSNAGSDSTKQETSTSTSSVNSGSTGTSGKSSTEIGTETTSSTPGTTTQTTSSTSSMGAPTSTTTASTSSTSNASAANSTDPVQGPLYEKRKLVLSRIQAAKKQGTGISGYMAEYGRIEQMVKNGEPEASYGERLVSLQSGIDDQIKRSQILKTQHPTYTGTSVSSGSASSSQSGGGGGGGGGATFGGMSIDQLKAKYGDKVPPGVAEKLGSMSPEQRKELLQSDILKKFLNK
jgi:hypothetical protein